MPQQIISISDLIKSFLCAMGSFSTLETLPAQPALENVEFLIDEEKRNLKKDNKRVNYSKLCHWKYFTKEEQEDLMEKYGIEQTNICFEYTVTYFEDDHLKLYIDPSEIDVDYIRLLNNRFGFYTKYISGVGQDKISLGQTELKRLMVLRRLAKTYPVKEQTN